MTTDRDALARVIADSMGRAEFGRKERDVTGVLAAAAADAVVAHLAATGPRDTGLRERIEREILDTERANRGTGARAYISTRILRGLIADTMQEAACRALAAPDPGPDQGDGETA